MTSVLNRLIELESEIHYRTPAPAGEAEFDFSAGRVPVLLSAPHGAAHTRNGRLKEEDEFTAGMARLVAELTGAHALFARYMSHTDPNYYPGVAYKRDLQTWAQKAPFGFVIDLHGAGERHKFGVALGTMLGGQSCPGYYTTVVDTLQAYGYREQAHGLDRLDIDNIFTGGGGLRQETVTRFCWQKLNIPAIQLEFHPSLRVLPLPNRAAHALVDPERVRRTVDLLCNLVQRLS
ncbi:MAG: hypothetical protein GYA17_19120 [Chloroflexi bacterium]|jgi:hypothetical protein|nr:hypothetical protein [Anaerolineaceae bacterium]NMB90479.1 hypothetical protein [Chloroflexota bacterium]